MTVCPTLRSALLPAALLAGLSLIPGTAAAARDEVSREQTAALNAVAKMAEAQRTYYQKYGRFRATVPDIQRDFGIVMPASYNYAVRTTRQAAYSYVIPARSPKVGTLNAYVGATFLTPNQTPKITTIICQNTQTGQIRPADPQLVVGSLVPNPTGRIVRCGNVSLEVKASVVNE
ncbi:type IV pilin-like G/H family protein [Synechococcus sp. CCY 9618]|uniref:type IV pilin-like G/H family protein n=1 Tax=Synechococcus sp. CCY 9618 TaxID=2815602 RepID=UPI001C24EE0A|nr:type IV pilin-like G/H family protein [Synechococcus sp. CCY 9618]